MTNSRNLIIGIAGVLIIGGIIYAVSMSKTSPEVTQTNTQQGQGAVQSTASTTAPQVQAQDVTVGTGAPATPNMVVSVLYVGKLADGTIFDSSEAHGNQPLIFQLGSQGLIPGFQIGVNGMKVGGERVMAIPATLGYGAQDVKDATGKIIIPANSTIQFDVKLVNVQTVEQAQAAQKAAVKPTATTTPVKPVKK